MNELNYISSISEHKDIPNRKVIIKTLDKYNINIFIPKMNKSMIFDLYEKHELRDYTTNKLILQDSSINESLEYAEELEKFNISQYANEFQQYRFTFIFRNGNYALDSIEPIND